jgi:hypothetical protein
MVGTGGNIEYGGSEKYTRKTLLFRKPEGRRSLERNVCTQNIIKADTNKKGREGLKWMHLKISSGLSCHVVRQKFTDISEVLTACIIRAMRLEAASISETSQQPRRVIFILSAVRT